MHRFLAAVAGLSALALATQASAHAHLTASDPAANAVVASPKQLTLHFSERLNTKFSGLTLTMANMGNMAVAAQVAVGKDGASLVATPTQTLAAGAYKVSWHAVTADTHRTEGSYSFTVR